MYKVIPTILDPGKLDPKNFVTIGDVSYVQFKANSYIGNSTIGVIPKLGTQSKDRDDIVIDLHSKIDELDAPIYIKDHLTITVDDGTYYTVHDSLFKYVVLRYEIVDEMTIDDFLGYLEKILFFKKPKYSIVFYITFFFSMFTGILLFKSLMSIFN